MDPEIIQATVREGLVSIPGALTPTEIAAAAKAGADFVKIFPASILGPAYIKAVLGPLSHIPVLAVGGIRPDSVAAYLNSGASGFGIGSDLAKKELLEAG